MTGNTTTNGAHDEHERRERIDALISESRSLVAMIREDRAREEAATRRARTSLKRAQRAIDRAAAAR